MNENEEQLSKRYLDSSSDSDKSNKKKNKKGKDDEELPWWAKDFCKGSSCSKSKSKKAVVRKTKRNAKSMEN